MMKFEVSKGKLYPNMQRLYQDKPIDKKRAQKLANNLVREYNNFLPLRWEELTKVELIGEVEGVIDAWLYFGINTVAITAIYVSDDMEILQAGTNYGHLTY